MRVSLLCPPVSAVGPASPPRHWPLYALLVAAALRERGFDVAFDDAHRRAPDPAAAARGVVAAGAEAALVFAADYNRRVPLDSLGPHLDALRAVAPDLPVLLSGRHSPDEARRLRAALPQATAVSVGEPEAAALAFLTGDGPGALRGDEPAAPAGLTATPASPAWDLARPGAYGLNPHQSRGAEVFPVLASRGCPYGCFYCEVRSQAAYAARAPDDVVAEVRLLMDRWGARSFFVADPMFALHRPAALEFAAKLAPLGVRWSAMTRTDRVDPTLLAAMAASGCWSLIFGVESLNPDAQSAMHKRLDVETVGPAIRAARAAGIEVIASAMVGLPGDTPAGVERTVQGLIDLEPDFAQFFEVRVPAEHAVQGGRVAAVPGDRFSFDGGHYIGDAFDGPDHVRRLTQAAYRRFYLRPGYVKTRLRAVRARPREELRRGLQGARIVVDRALGGAR